MIDPDAPGAPDPAATLPSSPASTVSSRPLAAGVSGIESLLPELARALLRLVDANDQPVAIKDLSSGRYVHVNERMAALLGRPAADVVGHTDAEIVDAQKASAWRAADQAVAGQQEATRSDHRFEIDGQRRDFTVWRVALPAPEGQPATHQLSLWTETTRARSQEAQLRAALAQVEEAQAAQVELQCELQDHALRDEVTGLYQHGHFQDQLRREVDLSAREHREFSLVSIALDPPDARMQAAGLPGRQRVLETLGRLLRQNTRAMDASCRLDEEHFSVLLSGVGLATAHSRMDGLRRQCAAQVVVQDGAELGFTVSMGVASFPHTSTQQDELIYAADKALLLALAKGNYVSLASITLE